METGFLREFNNCFTTGEKIARAKSRIKGLKETIKGYEEVLVIFENQLEEENKNV
jgi:hypothetical protein